MEQMIEFIDSMREAGVDPGATSIVPDGMIHRFRGPGDKPGRENCWYILFEHGGTFGSWRLGVSQTWHNGAGKLSKDERRKLDQQIKAAQAQAEAERKRRQETAAKKAKRLWNQTEPITDAKQYDYLLRKDIQPHGARRLHNLLVVPLHDVESGEIVNLEFVNPNGDKRFLSDGRVAGCYYPLADEALRNVARIMIAEGFATAATIHEATAIPVAVAFSAGNLCAVAKTLRKKYRDANIFVAADDDRATEGNPGVTKAREAATAVRGRLVIPAFPTGIKGKDFNDLASEVGLDGVRQQILAAIDFGVPANFRLSEESLDVIREHKTKSGEIQIEEVRICSRLEIVALTRDTNGGEWGRLLRFPDPDGRVHEWAMPTEMLAGDGAEYRRRLLEQGLTISPSQEARHGLHEYISQCRPATRARAVTRVGWHGNVFVFPDTVFGDTQGERTLYQSAVAIAHALYMRGSLEDWQREVAALCICNSRLSLAISAAFAAALLSLTNDESGGFNYVGRSSLGKTTALRTAGSVWGGSAAQHGYLRQWRATANGLEGVAALHCDTLLCLDELSEVSAHEAGSVAYMLANGQGKARAHRDGSPRPAFAWRVLFLSSGELTLADKVREDNRQRATAGQQVRVLDIPADAEVGLGLFENIQGMSNPQAFADHLRAATQNYYGTAARAFLSEVVREPGRVADAIRKYQDDFIKEYCPPGADGQVRRAATRFGLVAAAGELASALGITGWAEGEARSAAGACFHAWLRYRGHIGPAEVEAGIEQVRTFFALHGESRFSRPDSDDDDRRPPVYNRAGFRKDGYFCVFKEVFRYEIVRSLDWRLVANALHERGMLVPGEDGRLHRKVRDPETGKSIRMLCFTPEILGVEMKPKEPVNEAEAQQ